MSKFSQWLETQFLMWQATQRRRTTLGEFADFLQISRVSLSQYINGRRLPDDENIAKMAVKLGTEVYELMGRDLDSTLLFIVKNWDKLTDKQKQNLLATMEANLKRR
ncbi:MAG: helix-turn-helix transcriptional regulator [Chloroflexi bacterium]|nr:helix-turn-helix transcriptional regulator [Chloroflexota bacterium]